MTRRDNMLARYGNAFGDMRISSDYEDQGDAKLSTPDIWSKLASFRAVSGQSLKQYLAEVVLDVRTERLFFSVP